jgi:hypothetical protein
MANWEDDPDMLMGLKLLKRLNETGFHGQVVDSSENMADKVVRTCLQYQLHQSSALLDCPGWSTDDCAFVTGKADEDQCPFTPVDHYPGWYVCLNHMTAHDCTDVTTCRFVTISHGSYVCRVTSKVFECSIERAPNILTGHRVDYDEGVELAQLIDEMLGDDPEELPMTEAEQIRRDNVKKEKARQPINPYVLADPPAIMIEAVRSMLHPDINKCQSGFPTELIQDALDSMTDMRILHIARCVYRMIKLVHMHLTKMSPASTLLVFMHVVVNYMQHSLPPSWRAWPQTIVPAVYLGHVLAPRHTLNVGPKTTQGSTIQLRHSTRLAEQLMQIIDSGGEELRNKIDAIWNEIPT